MLENSPSLRPIPVERDCDHDQGADSDHRRADIRQLFQHADNDRSDVESSLHTREAPACDTHRTSPFGPQHRGATLMLSFTRAFLSTSHVKESDSLRVRAVERPDGLGCRLQHDLAALSFEIGFSFRR